MLTGRIFKPLHKCYQVIGKDAPLPSSRFWHFEIPNWENYLMSPILSREAAGAAEFERTLRHWEHHLALSSTPPYWTFFGKLSPTESRIRTELKKRGWAEFRPGRQGNLLTRKLPLDLPRGFRLDIGLPTERAYFREFESSGAVNFNTGDAFHQRFMPLFRAYPDRFRLVLIRNREGKPAASGIVANHAGYGFFLSGAVYPRYRGKGLWRQLVAARQATDENTHTWYYFTTNPLLKNRGSLRFSISHLAKPTR
jgi:GNAT superfamily N-acetyltransferase